MSDSDLKEFYYTQDGTQIRYLCVEFYYSSFGYIRLVQDQVENISKNVDGQLVEFTASSAVIPEDLLFSTNENEKGKITFNYIGYDIRTKLISITDLTPISARILQYIGEDLNPSYDKVVSVGEISLNATSCTIQLTLGNAAKQAKVDRLFTAGKFPGLSDQ